MFRFLSTLMLFYLFILLSCSNEKQNVELDFERMLLMDSEHTKIEFQNLIKETPNQNLLHYDYYYNGAGVSIGDINNDGLNDIYFCANTGSNKLYLNKGDFVFEDITDKAGVSEISRWSTGAVMQDVNGDGLLDIYVCNAGPNSLPDHRNALYINQGNLNFIEEAKSYGLDHNGFSTQSSFFDYDGDGDLDVFIINHLDFYRNKLSDFYQKFENLKPEEKSRRSCRLFRNEGNQRFVDVSELAGVNKPSYGLGLITQDINNDGNVDVYVSNDFFIPDFYFVNNGNGGFKDQIKNHFKHTAYYSMGCDAQDFNNDGLIDVATVDMTPSDHVRSKTNMPSMDVGFFNELKHKEKFVNQFMFNTLQLNTGYGYFSDIGLFTKTAKTGWSWSALFGDIDLDGDKDFFVTNGFKRDTRNNDWLKGLDEIVDDPHYEKKYFELLQKAKETPIQNLSFENKSNYSFEDLSSSWGMGQEGFSNGMALADLDNDGDLDIVVNNIDAKAFVYKNQTREIENANYIAFDFRDSKNKRIQNVKVEFIFKGQMQYFSTSSSRGYMSSMPQIAHFGLAENNEIEEVKITWPNQMVSKLKTPQVNKVHLIRQDLLASKPIKQQNGNHQFIEISSQQKHAKFRHKENNFNDFENEILLPQKQSTLGPGLAVGDLNGDGLDDFYIGGAKNQQGQIYLQKSNGFFVPSESKIKDEESEDLGAEFLDIDNDGDLDLYVASGGGGDVQINSGLLQDRLYENDGNGKFTKTSSLPKMLTSTSCIKASDFDGDGDVDLFIGGRNTPGAYPLPASSYLLQNENGIYKDVSSTFCEEFEAFGMVTDAIWIDVNDDGKDDLITVGEWEQINLFINESKVFINASEEYGLSNLKGWWYSIGAGDFDGDGDIDLVAGNLGLNTKFSATEEKPFHVYANDFDGSGSLDIVLSNDYNGKLVPVRGKECSSEQMPFIKDKFPSYQQFAEANIIDILGEDKIDDGLHLEVNTFKSIYLENKSGSFKPIALPDEAQFSPILGMVVKDFDGDSILDIATVGNIQNTEVETPSYDAGKGLFLKGSGNGEFKAHLPYSSGIFVARNAKDVQLLNMTSKNIPVLLVANNDDVLQFIMYNQDK